MRKKSAQLLCPLCHKPFVIKRLAAKTGKANMNSQRSTMVCSSCGLTAKEAVLKHLFKNQSG